tara:strand:+ start:529 stop:1206 length:678 start_codon:yes stop_codon:yes gene_type:complete
MPALLIGGLAMGGVGAFLGIGSANEQAKIAAYQAKAKHANDMSKRNWQVIGDSVNNVFANIEISRRNQARWRMNREIARTAISNKAMKEIQRKKKLGSTLAQINKGFQDSEGNLLAAASGSNINPNSGTFKALKRALVESTENTLTGAKIEDYAMEQAIIREYEAELGKRDLFSFDMPTYYVPGSAPQEQAVPQSASFFQQASAGLSGFGAGVSMVSNLSSLTGE